jgi:alpha-ribazole phosphatase
MTCRLILVRHATAAGNGRFQGHKDVSLTAVGRRELDALLKKCSRYSVSAVYSSDLLRARETAEAVARNFGLQVELRPALREMHFGQWEGNSWAQVRRRFPELACEWAQHFPHHAIPGAELFRHFKRRVDLAVRQLVAANRNRCPLAVTHAGVIRIVVAKVLGLSDKNLFRIAQDPCAVNVIDYYQDGAVVQSING